ncbi:MAG: helix-turn-helix domain-containing protein [Oscillospiraceae bacterium]
MYEVMFTDYPDIVNVAQVQSMLKISRHLAYELIGDGYIPGMKIGNAYRIPKINVIRYALGGQSAAGSVSTDLNLKRHIGRGISSRRIINYGPKGCPFMCCQQKEV